MKEYNFDNSIYNKLNEEFNSLHNLNEMAMISRPTDNIPRSTVIYIYNEKDEQGTKTPHFHVIIDNGKIELEVQFKHIKQMIIWRTKGNYQKSWNGINNVKKRIIDWLDEKPNKSYNPCKLSNLQRMIMAWNDNNYTNEIDEDYCK